MSGIQPANPPTRHHFLPECYQRLWAGGDGKIERFAIEHGGQIRARRLAPAAVGWEPHLYRIPGEPDPWAAQRVETDFFSPLDAAAASVMRNMLETGGPPTTGPERSTWASFLLALLHRTPENLSATFYKLEELNADLMPEAEQRYAELRGPNDPPTFAQWEADRARHGLKRSMLRTVMDVIANPSSGPYLINLRWAVLDVSAADHKLMVSDNPVILVPLKLDGGHLALAIGPDHLFVASEHDRFMSAIKKTSPRQIARTANRLMVERANRIVIASDRSQEHFVRKYFGTCRIGSLATGLRQPPRAV